MSRFFRGDSDSDSSSSSEEESLYSGKSEESEQEESDLDSDDGSDSDESSDDETERKKQGADYFLKGASSSDESDEDEGRRVVKSVKDKRMDELESSIRQLENAEKINDWVSVSNEFEKLNKIMQRGGISLPGLKLYLTLTVDLEESVNDAVLKERDGNAKKKLNAANVRALNTFRQRIRRNNKSYEADILRLKDDPSSFLEESAVAAPAPKKKKSKTLDSAVEDDDEGFATVGKGGKALTYTSEGVIKHLRAVFEARGKKGTDKQEQIKTLEKLLEVSSTPYQKIRVLLALISSRFDYASTVVAYLPIDQWKKALSECTIFLDILDQNAQYKVSESAEEFDDDYVPNPQAGEFVRIQGNIGSFMDRLHDELIKSLQNIDPHTPEYLERLKDESELYKVIVRVETYFQDEKMDLDWRGHESQSRVVMRRLEMLYYKSKQLIVILDSAAIEYVGEEKLKSSGTPYAKNVDEATGLIDALCMLLYKQGQPLLKTRAILCQIYHYALSNEYYKARDLLLMSHLQESIQTTDVGTQITYNRAMVQLGLCAFRRGMIPEALLCLQEIHSTARVKELLAQGVSARYGQMTPEQEKIEKMRQLPFHMYINLELLEAVFLTCSMLVELPAMAAAGSSSDAKRKVISKSFRRHLDYADRQIFVGPPENTRDHVMQASKALLSGEWERCRDLLLSIGIWDLLPDTEGTKKMLARKIQEEGLRTYLFSYSGFYDTIGVIELSEMFQLEEAEINAIVSKMITHDELHAALDRARKAIVLQRTDLTRLQTLALSLADKANYFQEQNEKAAEQRMQQMGNAPESLNYRRGQRDGRQGQRVRWNKTTA